MKRREGRKAGRRKGIVILVRSVWQLFFVGAVLLLIVYLPETWARPATGGADFTAHFFDVGQGDSSLVQCGRTQALIDGGPSRKVLQKLGRAMPFTDRRIEYVILSHPHHDHIFGLFEVLERYDVQYLIMTEYAAEHADGQELAELAVEYGTEVLLAESGDSIAVGDCGELVALWPDQYSEQVAFDGLDYDNDLSLVLELRDPTGWPLALFTGDINAEVEAALLADGALSGVSILKVPHHGSKHSSHYEFIRAVNPEHAVFQVGNNNYSQPSKTVLLRYEKQGVEISRNDLEGDIVFDLNE